VGEVISSDEVISAPVKILPSHDVTSFDCADSLLNDWLRRRALQNEQTGASRTYVVCMGDRVIAYYALAVGAVSHENALGRVRRNMPDPVPVMVLARLAVDQEYGDRGIGSGLLRDAIIRTLQAAEIAGIRAILVHAISNRAKEFYEKWGFASSPVDPLTLMISLREAAAAISIR
jgi:GNAT superfamily N-acetyltransferase